MASKLFTRITNGNGAEQNVLRVAEDQLQPWVHSPQSQALLAQQPGGNVVFAQSSIKPGHIDSHRQSYINAILIQSRGTVLKRACSQCSNRTASGHRRVAIQRFFDCRVVKGHFRGCCANCKWSDSANKCSYVCGSARDEPGPASDSGNETLNFRHPIEEAGAEAKAKAKAKIQIEEGKIQYEDVNDAYESQEKATCIAYSEILQKLLLPEYNDPTSTGGEIERLHTPVIKEENYSSEGEWQGFSS